MGGIMALKWLELKATACLSVPWTSPAGLKSLSWNSSPLKDSITIGPRWEKGEISGNICDKTQQMVKMGFCNSVNLCSRAGRHFSLQPKHIGYTAEGFSSNV